MHHKVACVAKVLRVQIAWLQHEALWRIKTVSNIRLRVKLLQIKLTNSLNFFVVLKDGSSAGVTWGILVALTLVGVIIFVFLYFRRRVQNLKTEIAHVTYIADPSSQPDRHHFDNPVYDFRATTGSAIMDTNTAVLNNIKPNKTSNIDKYLIKGSDSGSNSSSRCE